MHTWICQIYGLLSYSPGNWLWGSIQLFNQSFFSSWSTEKFNFGPYFLQWIRLSILYVLCKHLSLDMAQDVKWLGHFLENMLSNDPALPPTPLSWFPLGFYPLPSGICSSLAGGGIDIFSSCTISYFPKMLLYKYSEVWKHEGKHLAQKFDHLQLLVNIWITIAWFKHNY